jgi:hypothetical protein
MGTGRSLLLLHEALLGAALLAATSVAGAEQSAAPTFRTGTVRLYDCKDTATKVAEHPKDKFPSPWRVVPNSPTTPWPNGFVRIEMPPPDRQQHCVRAYTIDTNQPSRVTGECGPVVAGQKSAATRGVGEDCK